MEIQIYDTTKDLIKAVDKRIDKWIDDSLSKGERFKVFIYHQNLMEIRRHFLDTMEAIKDWNDQFEVISEMKDLQQVLGAFTIQMPIVERRAIHIIDFIFKTFGRTRSYLLRMDMGDFNSMERVQYRLIQIQHPEKRVEFIDQDPTRIYATSFPSEWLDMSDEEIRKNILKEARQRGFTLPSDLVV